MIARGTAEELLNPKTAAKRHATKNAAGKLAKSRPYLSRKADLDFLDAHDELNEQRERMAGMVAGMMRIWRRGDGTSIIVRIVFRRWRGGGRT